MLYDVTIPLEDMTRDSLGCYFNLGRWRNIAQKKKVLNKSRTSRQSVFVIKDSLLTQIDDNWGQIAEVISFIVDLTEKSPPGG